MSYFSGEIHMSVKPLSPAEVSWRIQEKIESVSAAQKAIIATFHEQAQATVLKMFVCFNKANGKIELGAALVQAMRSVHGKLWRKNKARPEILQGLGITYTSDVV